MKNLIIVIFGILSITSLNAQFDEYNESDGKLDITLQAKFDSIRAISSKEEDLRPTWKTGNDNSQLKGLLRDLFDDPLAKELYRLDETVSLLHVTGFNTIDNRTTVSDWLNTLDAGLFPSYLFSMRYNYDGEIEKLYIKDNDGKIVREIMIIWDKSFDGENYTNLRTIMDSYFNQ